MEPALHLLQEIECGKGHRGGESRAMEGIGNEVHKGGIGWKQMTVPVARSAETVSHGRGLGSDPFTAKLVGTPSVSSVAPLITTCA